MQIVFQSLLCSIVHCDACGCSLLMKSAKATCATNTKWNMNLLIGVEINQILFHKMEPLLNDHQSTPRTWTRRSDEAINKQWVRFTIELNQRELIGSTDQGTVAPPMFISSPPLNCKKVAKWRGNIVVVVGHTQVRICSVPWAERETPNIGLADFLATWSFWSPCPCWSPREMYNAWNTH